jgi:hypothetical protein
LDQEKLHNPGKLEGRGRTSAVSRKNSRGDNTNPKPQPKTLEKTDFYKDENVKTAAAKDRE